MSPRNENEIMWEISIARKLHIGFRPFIVDEPWFVYGHVQ